MKRYILTGTPGSGKTTLLRHLRALGYPTVEEAATDVIAEAQAAGTPEPWTRDDFVDRIVEVQRRRQVESIGAGGVQFFDRSPVCTHALSVFLGREPTEALHAEIDRMVREHVYEPEVFFVGNLGYVESTAARRISFEESLAFEAVHRESYEAFGFRLVEIPVAPAGERAALVVEAVARLGADGEAEGDWFADVRGGAEPDAGPGAIPSEQGVC
jgi:predicted ATPase